MTRALTLALVALVLLVFAQCIGFEFVNFDDPFLVTTNRDLGKGLTAEGLTWAFSTVALAQYHPLTLLTYLLDYQLFGLDPAGYHAVNVLLHLTAVLLLFSLLRTTTGNVWASALVAAVFAVHPLRAESVAWVAERKDVLSACLGLGCLRAWAAYGARPTRARYALVAGLFVLGLLAKPMLVTLPVIMLLLDQWPLRRFLSSRTASDPAVTTPDSVTRTRAVLEKVPLLALAVAAGVVAVIAQAADSALQSLARYPIGVRLANVVSSYAWYVWKLFVPTRLAVFYPFDRLPGAIEVALLATTLAAVTVWAVLSWRRRPYLLVGWGWFVVMLAPVAGIVQIGSQRVADRYSYLPHVGLLIAVVFLVADLLSAGPPWLRRVALGGACVAVLLLTWLGARQAATFRNSETLFTHALEVTENNYLAHTNLAGALVAAGQSREAELNYREAVRIIPQWEVPHFGLGTLLEEAGKLDEAAEEYRRGLASNPRHASIQRRLGLVLLRLGRRDEGVAHIEEAARLGDAGATELLRPPTGRPGVP